MDCVVATDAMTVTMTPDRPNVAAASTYLHTCQQEKIDH
jgi:hypothetical protein